MTARWQRVGCLLVVPYAGVTSLIVVPSGETTGYVCVITSSLTSVLGKPYFKRSTNPYVDLFTCLQADHSQIFIAALQKFAYRDV